MYMQSSLWQVLKNLGNSENICNKKLYGEGDYDTVCHNALIRFYSRCTGT